MKNTLLIIIIFSLVNIVYAGDIPDFELKSVDNEYVNYSDIKGEKLTIIDFWATWCKPCVNSIPKLNEIYNEYSDKGVEIVGINVDSPRNSSKIKPFVTSYGVSYTVLLDVDQEVTRELNVSAIPTLVIVNPDGDILFYHQGFSVGDEKIIREELDNLLQTQ